MNQSPMVLRTGLFLLAVAQTALSDGFPVVTAQPTNQIVTPGSAAVFGVTATGATGYQWRFNGADLPGATAATMTVTNAQFTNSGYYLVILKNSFGWTPSQMAYLSVVDTQGLVPSSNVNNPNAQAMYQNPWWMNCNNGSGPISNASAQVIAGPALDQMQAVSSPRSVANGYFLGTTRSVPTVAAGQTVYYRVDITYTNSCQEVYAQPSTVLNLVAGGGTYPVPSNTNLFFPGWIEWPEDPEFYGPPTNQVRVPGESFALAYEVIGFTDLGPASFQWRKDGRLKGSLIYPSSVSYAFYDTNITFTVTNSQPSDAGVYDLQALGNNWLISPKIYVNVQLTNGPGILVSPRLNGTNFLCSLIGAQTRTYTIQQSTNLSAWTDLFTVTNTTGAVSFTNPAPPFSAVYFRSRLLQ